MSRRGRALTRMVERQVSAGLGELGQVLRELAVDDITAEQAFARLLGLTHNARRARAILDAGLQMRAAVSPKSTKVHQGSAE